MSSSVLDFDEQTIWKHDPQILEALIADRTTGKNIIWACEDYVEYGDEFQATYEIDISLITGEYAGIIKPRIAKSREAKQKRTKGKAEVFTPAWVCNMQNNFVEESWFGRKDVFNVAKEKTWKATTEPIEFPVDDPDRTWQKYVDDNRLEITCGEAPYLASRYDAVTGEAIKLSERIGMLDRKLRVVGENCKTHEDWLIWARRAVEATYGFEFQGDNLLLARENLLMTYQDYRTAALGVPAGGDELLGIAEVISWNIWQMDGLTLLPPYQEPQEEQMNLFDDACSTPCVIRDWREDEVVVFQSLLNKEV